MDKFASIRPYNDDEIDEVVKGLNKLSANCPILQELTEFISVKSLQMNYILQ